MLMTNIPVIMVLFSLSWVVGMGIYSVYSDCDPLRAGFTKSADALLPFYVEDKYSFIPGLIGIFLATLFNSALILNVSNLNSLATVTWEDFLSKLPRFTNMEDSKQLRIIKIIGTIYGLMIMGVAFGVQLISGVIEAAQLMTSATSGPMLGVFVLAILVPVANWKGATVGIIASHFIILFITYGHLTLDRTSEFLETSITGCTNESFSSAIIQPGTDLLSQLQTERPWIISNLNSTIEKMPTITKSFSDYSFPENIYAISYMWYSVFGTLLTVFIGTFVSLLTRSDADSYDSKFIHPAVYKITRFFKGSEKLFSNEQINSSEIKNSSLREQNEIEQHDNKGFNAEGEDIFNKIKLTPINELDNTANFKSNIIYSNETNHVEKYKKLDEF
jgi:solute carrier family 5 (sodium-coupled monocarboxylate transporter), member 8/12